MVEVRVALINESELIYLGEFRFLKLPSLGEQVWMETPTKQLNDSEYDWPQELEGEVVEVTHVVPSKIMPEPSALIYIKRNRPLEKDCTD